MIILLGLPKPPRPVRALAFACCLNFSKRTASSISSFELGLEADSNAPVLNFRGSVSLDFEDFFLGLACVDSIGGSDPECVGIFDDAEADVLALLV